MTAELGHPLNDNDLRLQSKTVWGGVSWPGKRPGFAVVVAVDRYYHLESHDVYLLDEFESSDTRDLVRQCGALDFAYGPDRWVGDYLNDAADEFIREMNDESEQRNPREYGKIRWESRTRRRFSLSSTPMIEKKDLYQYILGQIKELLRRKQLFLKHGKVASCIAGIEESEIPELKRGDYPAIEALAFAAIGGREYEEFILSEADRGHPMQGYAPRETAPRFIHGQPKEVRVF